MPSVELPEFQSLIVEGSQSCCTIKKNCQMTLSQTHKHILHIEPGTAATWIFVGGYIVSTPEAVFPILCSDNWNGCTFVFWILDYTKMEIQYSYTKLPVNIDSRWLNITHIYIYTYIYRYILPQDLKACKTSTYISDFCEITGFATPCHRGLWKPWILWPQSRGTACRDSVWPWSFWEDLVSQVLGHDSRQATKHPKASLKSWDFELTDLWQIVWRTSNFEQLPLNMFSGIHVLFRYATSNSSRFIPFSKPTGLPTSFKCSQQATDLEQIRMPFVKRQKCNHTFLGESSLHLENFSVRSLFQCK